MITSATGYTFLDRHKHPLEIGQKVKVKHCIGRYGQTETLIGELVNIDNYGGVTIAVNGTEKYACGLFKPDFKSDSKHLIGYSEHIDFEHGHEKFIEIEPEPNPQEMTMTTPCPRCTRLQCSRCDHTDVARPRNYGRIMQGETRLWCLCCGLLWEPNDNPKKEA